MPRLFKSGAHQDCGSIVILRFSEFSVDDRQRGSSLAPVVATPKRCPFAPFCPEPFPTFQTSDSSCSCTKTGPEVTLPHEPELA